MSQSRALTLIPLVLLSMALLLSTPANAITASSDKDTYGLGECVLITGTTGEPNTLVTFTVYSPSDRLITLDQARSDDNAEFSLQLFCFPSEPSDQYPEGAYSITVKDVGTGEEVTVTVTLVVGAAATNTTTATASPTPSTVTVTVTETVNQTITKTVTTTVTDTLTTTATVTQTQTVTNTVTQTQTVTQTITQTQTTTATVTQTQTTTSTVTQTQTQTVTNTVTQTQTVTNAGATIGAAGVALVIGFAAAFLLSRSKAS